ncbi:MAG TPA: hypothetical protein VGF28_21570 [Thermoanaerobaculia bacterium]|jgi:hypothetical protein
MTYKSIAAGTLLSIVVIAWACQSNQAADVHVAAADTFTTLYSRSRLSGWKVEARAASADCSVLLIETSIVMEESMIEAMHYGAGAYDVYDGGVQKFYRDRGFRGVAYRDSSGTVWRYGAVTEREAETLAPCR